MYNVTTALCQSPDWQLLTRPEWPTYKLICFLRLQDDSEGAAAAKKADIEGLKVMTNKHLPICAIPMAKPSGDLAETFC